MSVTRRSILTVLTGAALAVPLASPAAAPAQSLPCNPADPDLVTCITDLPRGAVDAVRDICIAREGKYCLATVGDVIDRYLPPLD